MTLKLRGTCNHDYRESLQAPLAAKGRQKVSKSQPVGLPLVSDRSAGGIAFMTWEPNGVGV